MNKKKLLLKYTNEKFFNDPKVLRRIIYEQEKEKRKLRKLIKQYEREL